MSKEFYSYKKKDLNIKTKYIIEYTRDKKVIGKMGKADFNYNLLDKKEFDYLNNVVNAYVSLFYDKTVLYVMLYEQVILNGEVVLEQSKDMLLPDILPAHIRNRVNDLQESNKILNERLLEIENALAEFDMTIDDVIEQCKKRKQEVAI